MDRITEMKLLEPTSRAIFKEIGNVRWTPFDSFEVKTKAGATLFLSPNSDFLPSTVRIDEITVPERMRRRGIASEALATLCRLADKYNITLEGGPVGWSDSPWSARFVAWLRRFGFTRDPELPPAHAHDATVFNIQRRPKRQALLRNREQLNR